GTRFSSYLRPRRLSYSTIVASLLIPPLPFTPSFFFFNAPATTEIYTLSLHDALPISSRSATSPHRTRIVCTNRRGGSTTRFSPRSEEHTSELQSRSDLVCRLLLEKKKKKKKRKQYKKKKTKNTTKQNIKISTTIHISK